MTIKHTDKTTKYTFSNETILEAYPVLRNRTFTRSQLCEVYRDLINKKSFPDYEEWKAEMLEKEYLKEL